MTSLLQYKATSKWRHARQRQPERQQVRRLRANQQRLLERQPYLSTRADVGRDALKKMAPPAS